MIDHGFAFDGPNWDFADSPCRASTRAAWSTMRSVRSTISALLDQVIHFPEE